MCNLSLVPCTCTCTCTLMLAVNISPDCKPATWLVVELLSQYKQETAQRVPDTSPLLGGGVWAWDYDKGSHYSTSTHTQYMYMYMVTGYLLPTTCTCTCNYQAWGLFAVESFNNWHLHVEAERGRSTRLGLPGERILHSFLRSNTYIQLHVYKFTNHLPCQPH